MKNLKALRDLDKICFPEDDPLLFGLKKYHCWLVFDGDDVVSYAVGCRLRKYYFLARGGVVPEWRGRRIQQLLIKERVKKAIASSFNPRGVITYTSTDNIASIKNLRSCGFEEWNNSPKWFKASPREGCEFIEWIFKLDSSE